MLKKKALASACSIVALAFVFGSAPVYAQSSSETVTTTVKTSSISKADKKMMTDLAHANISEIAAAKLAQSKTQNEEVKNFAQRMIDDHTKAQQALESLAQSKGVTLPKEPDTKHKATAKMLEALSGDTFDHRYIAEGGISDHKKTIKLLEKIQNKATDSDLKALASKTLPTVEEHLKMAQQIQSSNKNSKQSSNSSGVSSSATAASGK
jgi:putative membrane protein